MYSSLVTFLYYYYNYFVFFDTKVNFVAKGKFLLIK